MSLCPHAPIVRRYSKFRDPSSLLILTGFVSTGKTSSGKQVAARLSYGFVDMDLLLETRLGKTVRAIYRTRGQAYLRAREAELCRELAGEHYLVVATGGGTLLDPLNLECFARAFVVCLDASSDDIVARLGDVSGRPLFQGASTRDRVRALLQARTQAYARIPLHVDTTCKSIAEVTDQVIALFQAERNGHPNWD